MHHLVRALDTALRALFVIDALRRQRRLEAGPVLGTKGRDVLARRLDVFLVGQRGLRSVRAPQRRNGRRRGEQAQEMPDTASPLSLYLRYSVVQYRAVRYRCVSITCIVSLLPVFLRMERLRRCRLRSRGERRWQRPTIGHGAPRTTRADGGCSVPTRRRALARSRRPAARVGAARRRRKAHRPARATMPPAAAPTPGRLRHTEPGPWPYRSVP